MNRLIVSLLLCMASLPGTMMGSLEKFPQKSSVNQEFLAMIRDAVISNDVMKVLRTAEALYSTSEGSELIQVLNTMLCQLGRHNEASQALRSRMASFQRAEIPAAPKRALPVNPGLIFAQRIFDAIENDNPDELVTVIEDMVFQIHLVHSLNIMNIMIVNLAQERLADTRAYATLRSCFQMLSPQVPVKLPVPQVPQRKKPAARPAPAAAPAVARRTEKVGTTAHVQIQRPAPTPIAQDVLLERLNSLKPVAVATRAASAVAPQIGQHLLRPAAQSKGTAVSAVAPVAAKAAAASSSSQKELETPSCLPAPPTYKSKPAQGQACPPASSSGVVKSPAQVAVPQDDAPAFPPRNRPSGAQHFVAKQPAPAPSTLQEQSGLNTQATKKEAVDSEELEQNHDEWTDDEQTTQQDDAAAREASQASRLLYNKPPTVARSYTPEAIERLEAEAAYITPIIQDTLRRRRESLKEDEDT